MSKTPEQNRAVAAVGAAIRAGTLTRPAVCSLCDLDIRAYNRARPDAPTRIEGHHWAGYEGENRLKVWWVCSSCNTLLAHRHDGSLSRPEARALVLASPLTAIRLKIAAGEAPARPVVEGLPAGQRREPETLRPAYQPKLF